MPMHRQRPLWNSKQFTDYVHASGFHHRKITPLHPSANGIAERMMKSFKRLLQTAEIEHKNWRYELLNFLRAYRATSHTTTGESPHQLLYNWPPHTRLPQIIADTSTPDNTDTIIWNKDSTAKEKMKRYADKKRHARDHSLQIGDTVLIHQQKKKDLG